MTASISRRRCLTAALAMSAAPVGVFARPAVGRGGDAGGVIAGEDARADLSALYLGLEQAHYDLFAHRSRQDYDRLYAQTLAGITGPVERDRLARVFQAFTAYGQVGHARIDAPTTAFVQGMRAGGRFLPLFVRVDDGRVLLTATADREGRFPAGAELLSLNGEAMPIWLERLSAWVSGERPYMIHAQMESAFPVLLGFALGDVDGVTAAVRLPDGVCVEGRIAAVTLAGRAVIREAWPILSPGIDFGARDFRLLEDGVACLRPGGFAEHPGAAGGGQGFVAFVDAAFNRALDARATDMVIDLRNNPGGDNSFSDPMVAWFATRPFMFASSFRLRASPQAKAWYRNADAAESADPVLRRLAAAEAAQPDGARYPFELETIQPRAGRRFDGRVHVLVNRHSYSNATSVAALVQDYGFATVWGEETADVPTTYASILSFDLPRTGFAVTFPKSRIVRPNGDERVIGVVPDRVLPREPISAVRDTVMDTALAAIRGG
ncbi:S41 family peptidase [Brevundimonas sp. FT23042]|uniref:S41 family peptidase n=1 Tax=Brevundimonas sp. FT23042 TaxID=3393749 RepID=UPI003B58AEC3